VTALREIKLLRELRGPYIVQLLDVFAHKRKNLQLVRSPHRLRVAFMQWRQPPSCEL
jgi:serine/threonine protein kinase